MKAQNKVFAAVILSMIAQTALAADLPKKAQTRIEFNSMIDQNNMDRRQLQKTVSVKMESESAANEAVVSDQKKVLDLVDIEVGVGEDRPVVVDRRYNSIGEAVIDSQFSSNVQVTLPDDMEKADKGS